MTDTHEKIFIGRAEKIDLPTYGLFNIPAKVDTGSDLCAIWASNIHIEGHTLSFVFFNPQSEYYTGEIVTVPQQQFEVTRIANSFGGRQLRYKVKLKIRLKGRAVHATFTLSDRSAKIYPVLIGRRLLRGKFVVDVKEGAPLVGQEQEKFKTLRRDLRDLDGR